MSNVKFLGMNSVSYPATYLPTFSRLPPLIKDKKQLSLCFECCEDCGSLEGKNFAELRVPSADEMV